MLQLICVFTGVERLYPGNPEWLCTSTASGYRLSHGLGCLEGSEMLGDNRPPKCSTVRNNATEAVKKPHDTLLRQCGGLVKFTQQSG